MCIVVSLLVRLPDHAMIYCVCVWKGRLISNTITKCRCNMLKDIYIYGMELVYYKFNPLHSYELYEQA